MRARNFKPGFFKNEELAALEPVWRLLFIGLWCMADREGRLEDRPRRIRAEILPYETCDVEIGLRVLASKGFIVRYQVGEAQFIQVAQFQKHQNPHKREPDSEIPPPPGRRFTDERELKVPEKAVQVPAFPEPARLTPSSLTPSSLTPHSNTNTLAPNREGAGGSEPVPQEILGLELYEADKRLCRKLPGVMKAWTAAYPGVDLKTEIAKAHAWEMGNPTKRKRDRIRFLTGWLNKAQDSPTSGRKNGGSDAPNGGKSFVDYAAIARAKRAAAGVRDGTSAGALSPRRGTSGDVQAQADGGSAGKHRNAGPDVA